MPISEEETPPDEDEDELLELLEDEEEDDDVEDDEDEDPAADEDEPPVDDDEDEVVDEDDDDDEVAEDVDEDVDPPPEDDADSTSSPPPVQPAATHNASAQRAVCFMVHPSQVDHASITPAALVRGRRAFHRARMFLPVAVACLLAAAEPPLPTSVVMPLNARNGVTPDAASLITDNLVDEFRRSRAFHRVTSWPEAQALLSLEQARQVVDCDDTGCVTEIVGALNVDYAVVGSLGRLGRHWLINVQLLNVRASTAAASISLRVCAQDEGGLLAGVVPTVTALLHEAKLSRRRPVELAPQFRDCPEPPPPGSSAPDGAATRPATDEGGGFPVVRVATATAGLAGGLLGALLGVASVAGAVVTAAYISRLLTPAGLASIRTGSLENEARLLLLWGVAGALGLPALVVGVVSLVLVGAGITAVAVAIITGVAS